MSNYKIHYHHKMESIGHFYVEFEGLIPKGIDKVYETNGKEPQKFFGKNPSVAGMPIWDGMISDEKDDHKKWKINKKVITTTRELTREQFEAGYRFAINARDSGGGIYTATEDHCIFFGQQVHIASGGKNHFINLFPKEQLASASNIAAAHSMQYYDSGARIVSGENIEDVSYIYGIDKGRVHERSQINNNGITYKTFTILPEEQGASPPPPRGINHIVAELASKYSQQNDKTHFDRQEAIRQYQKLIKQIGDKDDKLLDQDHKVLFEAKLELLEKIIHGQDNAFILYVASDILSSPEYSAYIADNELLAAFKANPDFKMLVHQFSSFKEKLKLITKEEEECDTKIDNELNPIMKQSDDYYHAIIAKYDGDKKCDIRERDQYKCYAIARQNLDDNRAKYKAWLINEVQKQCQMLNEDDRGDCLDIMSQNRAPSTDVLREIRDLYRKDLCFQDQGKKFLSAIAQSSYELKKIGYQDYSDFGLSIFFPKEDEKGNHNFVKNYVQGYILQQEALVTNIMHEEL